MNIVILGATKGIGRALSRLCAAQGDRLFLLGRDTEDLKRSAADLNVRSDRLSVAGFAHCDLETPDTFALALAQAQQNLGHLDAVVVTAALFGTQDELEENTALLQRVLSVNFAHTVLFCEAARKLLLAQGKGVLCVFGSVAGDRARKKVVLYGATKAGLSSYLEGLDHKYHHAGLRVVCVRPGFVKTQMTQGLPPPPFSGQPDDVARDVREALLCPRPIVYTPPVWRLVLSVIQHLPRAVMRRIDF